MAPGPNFSKLQIWEGITTLNSCISIAPAQREERPAGGNIPLNPPLRSPAKRRPTTLRAPIVSKEPGPQRISNAHSTSASPSAVGTRPASRARRQASSLGLKARVRPTGTLKFRLSPRPSALKQKPPSPNSQEFLSLRPAATASSRQEGSRVPAQAFGDV